VASKTFRHRLPHLEGVPVEIIPPIDYPTTAWPHKEEANNYSNTKAHDVLPTIPQLSPEEFSSEDFSILGRFPKRVITGAIQS
jgi:hypothetical protein